MDALLAAIAGARANPGAGAPLVAAVCGVLGDGLRPPRDFGAALGADAAWSFVSETSQKRAREDSKKPKESTRESKEDSSDEKSSDLAPPQIARLLETALNIAKPGHGVVAVFVQLALMQQSLHAWLRVLVDDPSASRAFYEQKAIMRDKLAMDKIIKTIEVDVSPLEFHFVFKRDGSSPATSPLGQTVLPNPAPLVHALSHAATTNASILASSAFEIGKGAFGFGLQTFAAAKESLDSKMVTLNLNSKRSILDMKSSAAQIDTAPPPPPIGYNRQSVSASGGAPSVGVLGVTNVPREDIDSPTEMGIAPDLLIFQLKQELEDTRKTVNDEREARRQLQADFLNLKHSKDREVASLRNEISLLQKQLILAKKPFHDINDI